MALFKYLISSRIKQEDATLPDKRALIMFIMKEKKAIIFTLSKTVQSLKVVKAMLTLHIRVTGWISNIQIQDVTIEFIQNMLYRCGRHNWVVFWLVRFLVSHINIILPTIIRICFKSFTQLSCWASMISLPPEANAHFKRSFTNRKGAKK